MTDLYDRPEALALIDAAKETPEDDGPRLVLADWLEDHSDPSRAEFIRLQVGMSARKENSTEAQEREDRLIWRYGGAWLGSLWQYWLHPSCWHRGLLSVGLPRCQGQEEGETLSWIDTLVFKTTGLQSFVRLAGLLESARPNHLFLDLSRPLSEARLLEHLSLAPEIPWLRSVSIDWPLRLQRSHESHGGGPGTTPTVSADFLAGLLTQVPLCRHLTHLASLPRWSVEQAQVIRSLGIKPVSVRSRLWMHALPCSSFRARNPSLSA